MDFNEILTYPMQSDDWVKTTLIGGILIFLGVFLIPLFVVYGYVVRTVRGSFAGETAPPAFGEWGELLVDGAKAWAISFVYLLVPLVVAGVTIGGSIAAIATGSEAGAAAGAGGLFVGFVVSSLLALVFGYFSIVAIVNFARAGNFGAAFDVDVIKTVAFNREYAIAWLVSVGIFVVVGFVGAIPVIGWLLAPFVSFYAAVIAANLWAGGFEQSLDTTMGVIRPKDEETAA
ncbi:MAG: DUF4013 domain-containing protein [Halobacteriota archaeon]